MFEFERAVSVPSLWAAWQKAERNNSQSCGTDQISLDYYRFNARENISILHYSLVSGSYEPQGEKAFVSRKDRTVYISCLEDKIVQTSLAQVIYDTLTVSSAVHGFIRRRSVFTAHDALKKSLKKNVTGYFKADISQFYETIDKNALLSQLSRLINDSRFISLVKKVLSVHSSGLSAGSALSPVLSNLYLSEFDIGRQENTVFYSRYVDDMLLAPLPDMPMRKLISGTDEALGRIGLSLNMEKSRIVNSAQGFKYLGFDIKTKNQMVDDFILSGDFASADELINTAEETEGNPPSAAAEAEKQPAPEAETAEAETDEEDVCDEIPAHILAVPKKCHMVRWLINKAKLEKYLSYPEKQTILQIFRPLGDDGQKYIHQVLSVCDDYDYSVTQGYINRSRTLNPLGCRKLCERFEEICDKSKCKCNFSNDKFYPSPVIHAIRRKPDCVILPGKEDNIGHFKVLPPKQNIEDTLSRMLELNKKEYEIREHKKICSGQLESLFVRSNITEMQTPQGLLIKNEDGFYVKVG